MREEGTLRIAYVIDNFGVGGTELHAVRLAEAIDRDRYSLTVFHLAADGPLRERYLAMNLEMIHVPIPNLYSAATAMSGYRFAELLRKRLIDVVHTHDIYTNSFAAPWARLRSSCGVLASRRWTHAVPRPGLRTVNRLACRCAHRILANSNSVADFLVHHEQVPRSKIVVLQNFVGESAFSVPDEMSRLRQRAAWGIPPSAFLVGCVSRLVEVKNHAFLLRALAMLPATCHLALVGGGPLRADLESLAVKLGIDRRVHFTGELISTANFHHSFDVSALVSRSEGFPNSVVEAMAASRPVVATPAGGVPDLIEHGSNGLLVEHDNVEMLAAHLNRLRSDANLARRLGTAAHAMARQRLHESAVVAQQGAIYDELALLCAARSGNAMSTARRHAGPTTRG